jgi:hypothetical protein
MNDPMVAELAVRQLHARYLDAVWRLMTFRTPLDHIENGAVTSRTYVTEQNSFLGRNGETNG